MASVSSGGGLGSSFAGVGGKDTVTGVGWWWWWWQFKVVWVVTERVGAIQRQEAYLGFCPLVGLLSRRVPLLQLGARMW